MTAARIDLRMERGARFRRGFLVRERRSKEPVDLTGSRVQFVAEAEGETSPVILLDSGVLGLLDATVTSGPDDTHVLSVEPLAGKIEVALLSAYTSTVTYNAADFKLVVFDSLGEPDYFVRGRLIPE
jgi:hypothetical protein